MPLSPARSPVLRQPTPAPVQQPPAEPPRRDFSPLAAVFGIALLGGMLLIGVLLGREGSEDDPPPAQTVQVGEGQTTTTAPSQTETPEAPATGAVVSEWPAGTDGFTIRLQALPKDGTTSADVDRAKSDLTAEGASEVGVLDSDLYPSLDPGEYVIYSGVYTDRATAKAALKSLEATVPDAELAQVSPTPTTQPE